MSPASHVDESIQRKKRGRRRVPGTAVGAGAEHVGARAAPGVPVAHAEAKPVLHGATGHHLVGTVVLEREGVHRLGSCRSNESEAASSGNQPKSKNFVNDEKLGCPAASN
jgi:hypothetical protein